MTPDQDKVVDEVAKKIAEKLESVDERTARLAITLHSIKQVMIVCAEHHKVPSPLLDVLASGVGFLYAHAIEDGAEGERVKTVFDAITAMTDAAQNELEIEEAMKQRAAEKIARKVVNHMKERK
jgi:hypothetical protein